MAALATNVVPNTGLRVDDLLAAASSGGDTCQTGPGIFLLVKNGSGSAVTVTLATPQVVDGDLAVANRDVTVAATTGQSVIPVPHLYRNSATGRAAITYSATTTVTVCVVKVS